MPARRTVLLALGVAVLVFAALHFAEPVPDTLRPGAPAPDFELARFTGESESLAAQRGKVVLINFWATWCRPCLEEMPSMERLYRDLAGEAFEMLAISVDETAEPIGDFRERLGLTFPILLDPEQRVAALYQTFHYPESYLVDAEGRIVSRYIGPREWDSSLYREHIRALLGAP